MRFAAVPGEVVEQLGEIGPDLRRAGQQSEILVQARRRRVVVPGPDVALS